MNSTTQNTLTEGKLAPALLRFAVPFLISNFLQALYGAVDLFVVGQFSTSASVSAVAIGSQVMQTVTWIILGISMGGTVLIGQKIGEKNEEGAAEAVGCVAVLFGLMALVLTPLMLMAVNGAVALMKTPPEAVSAARSYIFICSCGLPFITGYNGVSGIFRGIGDSRIPVIFIGLACIVNVIGDFLFTGWMGMGAAGAAFATVIAQAVSFLAALAYMYKKGFSFPFGRRHLRLRRKPAAAILKVGFPLALQDALVNVSFLIITTIINTMGLTASAAVGVVEKIISFAMLPPSAIASAVTTVTAQNIGAKKPERAKRALWYGIGFSLIFGIAVCIFVQFFAPLVTAVFSRDEAVILAAAQYLRSYSYDCILVSFVFCINSYFSGRSNALVPFIHSMIATFLVRIPATYGFSLIAGDSLFPMGLAAPLASFVSIVICFGYMRWEETRKR